MLHRTPGLARAAIHPLLAVVGLVSVYSAPAAGQNQLWVDQLGTPWEDRANASAPGLSGDVFLSGWTSGSLGGPSAGAQDAWIARYDGSGSMLWLNQFGTSAEDGVLASAPDGSGGAYVAGRTVGSLGGPHSGGYDAWLARVDSQGNVLWMDQLGTAAWDQAFALATNGSGGVFVGGQTSGSLGGTNAGGEDAWLARYNSSGFQLWIRQIGTSGHDPARSAAPDGAGGVYLTGYTYGSLGGTNAGSADAWLAHYDKAGNSLWMRQLGTSALDYCTAAAMDGAGGLYLSGSTKGSLGGSSAGGDDGWIARYDRAGNQLWVRQIGTGSNDAVLALAHDSSVGVFLTGRTAGDLGGPCAGMADGWVAAYTRFGERVWLQQLGTAAEDIAWTVAPDGSAGVFIGGQTSGSLGGQSAGGADAWLAHYDSSCPAPQSYCVASTTSIPGCQAAIAGVGTPSFANPTGFTISSGAVPGSTIGISFFGNHGRASIPFGTLGGQICVQGTVIRTAPRMSGGTTGNCDGQFAFILQDLIDKSPIVFAGAILNAQIWARDPANPDGFLLSDGLEFTVCP